MLRLCLRLQAPVRPAGSPCWSVGGTSEGIGHQWNIVRLDGENYIVDCTWDDTTGTDNYFLCPVDSPDYQIDDTSLYGW